MAAQYVTMAQQAAQQASTIAAQFGQNVATTINALNLPQYLAPLSPLLDSVSLKVQPLLQKATVVVLPHLSPYMDLAAPYIGGAKPHLDKVTQKELVLILGVLFGGVFALQVLFCLTAMCRRGASKLKAFTPTVFWLLFCFITHTWIESAFVWRRTKNASGFQAGMDLYGAADNRYGFGETLDLEAGTAAMEAITAMLVGPMCLLLAWGIVGNKPWRWALQIIVCTCQLYGLGWFMAHPFFTVERVSSTDPFLYWVIFVGMNAPWGIVPPLMLLSAVRHINRSINKLQTLAADEKAAQGKKVSKK